MQTQTILTHYRFFILKILNQGKPNGGAYSKQTENALLMTIDGLEDILRNLERNKNTCNND